MGDEVHSYINILMCSLFNLCRVCTLSVYNLAFCFPIKIFIVKQKLVSNELIDYNYSKFVPTTGGQWFVSRIRTTL